MQRPEIFVKINSFHHEAKNGNHRQSHSFPSLPFPDFRNILQGNYKVTGIALTEVVLLPILLCNLGSVYMEKIYPRRWDVFFFLIT